jgi:hypothetical protein
MRVLLLTFVVSLALCDAASAQQPAVTEPRPPADTILTGCLRSSGADVAVAGPSGRLYTLEVTEAAKPSTEATAAGATTGSGSKVTYSLSVPSSIDLEKHADHEVQLTGRLQPPSTPRPPAGSPTTTAAPSQKPQPGGAHRTFQVASIKMISAKCP